MATFASSNLSAAAVDALCQGVFYATNGGTSWTADAINCALYSTTPDSALAKNDTLAHNTYLAAGGQWVTGNEITGTGYTAGGQALGTKTHTFGSGTTQMGAASPSWTSTTITAGTCFGCLVYDATLTAKYAYCWNYFGGGQGVTGGTFSVNWSGAGILQFTIN